MAEKKTKALLFTEGESQEVKFFNGNIVKESFTEHDFAHEKTTVPVGILGATTTQDAIVVGEQKVYALFFADGTIYEVGKGFRDRNPDLITKKWIATQAKALKPVKGEEVEQTEDVEEN